MATFGNVYPYSSIYPGKFIPASAPSVIVSEPTWTGSANAGASSGVRVVIPASDISANASTVQVQFVTNSGADIVSAYIGHQASSGDAYDFDGTQVELLFSGTSGFSIGSGEDIHSDTTTYSVDSTKNLIISYGWDSTANLSYRSISGTNVDTYAKSSAASESGTTDVTGYTNQGGGGIRYFVGEILKIS